LVLEKIFKGNAFLAHFGTLCAFDEVVVLTIFVGTNPSYMCAKNKVCRCSSLEKKRFEAIVDRNAYVYERP
jgi:hypothetical protein